MRIILAIEKALKKGRTIQLGRTPPRISRKNHPSLAQHIHRPGVKEPETVRVRAPSA